jgi:hypothetical protein
MEPTERHSKFVAHLATKRAPLRKLEMMRIRRCAATDKAGLGADEFKVSAVALSKRFAKFDNRLSLGLGCYAYNRSIVADSGRDIWSV